MGYFYKIPAEIAESIGYFEYAEGKAIDLLVGKQKDGTYLISEAMHTEFVSKYQEIKAYMEDSKQADDLKNWQPPATKITEAEAKSGQEEIVKGDNEIEIKGK